MEETWQQKFLRWVCSWLGHRQVGNPWIYPKGVVNRFCGRCKETYSKIEGPK
jgi:hypothetical protein